MPIRSNATRRQILIRALIFLSSTFGRRDVADLADVDEEQSEEQEVPLHVELQMETQLMSRVQA